MASTRPCAPPGTAFVQFDDMGLQKRNAIIAAIRDAMREHGSALASEAHEETGLGRYEDKILKNQLVTEKTPGTEDLQPQAITGDHGLNLTEPAPYGVIAAITPTTNPTSTIINNAIGMVAAGNAVVFNVHPNARRVSCHNVALLNKAILAAGGPRNLVACIANPTVESAQALMKHPGIRLVVVTGGGGVVKAAMEAASAPSAPAQATRRSWWMRPPTLTKPRATSSSAPPSTTTSSAPTRRNAWSSPAWPTSSSRP